MHWVNLATKFESGDVEQQQHEQHRTNDEIFIWKFEPSTIYQSFLVFTTDFLDVVMPIERGVTLAKGHFAFKVYWSC